MSKKTLRLLLIIFSVAAFWLQIYTKITYATQVFDVPKYGVKFTVTHDPDRLYTESSSVTVTVTTDRNFFDLNSDYAYLFQSVTDKGCFFGSSNAPEHYKAENATTYKATLKLGMGCTANPGGWTFSLSQVVKGTSTKEELFSGYQIVIEQTGGQLPSIQPLNDPLKVGTIPSVVLVNPRINNNYEFWWAGAIKSFATNPHPITAISNNNVTIPLLEDGGGNFNAPGDKILCMKVKKKGDWDRFPGGVTCEYQTIFHYQLNIMPPSTGCTLDPSANASTVDSISIRIANSFPNTDIEGYLEQAGNTLNRTTGKTDDYGNALLSLGNTLSQGSYITHIINTATQQPICPNQQLNITEKGSVPNPPAFTPTKCDDPTKCSESGGKPTEGCTNNDKSPAIATAIGCIHTNPAEFAKDLLTWVIGIGGGIAFLMMLLGAFQMLTSAGNPETLQAGRDRLTSAVIGLLFIIFAVLLMQIIGVDILGIPEFK
ncbi:pilin [Patescibacteria group bacterium]|nr:pilin [Patescibacteria group bacterium]